MDWEGGMKVTRRQAVVAGAATLTLGAVWASWDTLAGLGTGAVNVLTACSWKTKLNLTRWVFSPSGLAYVRDHIAVRTSPLSRDVLLPATGLTTPDPDDRIMAFPPAQADAESQQDGNGRPVVDESGNGMGVLPHPAPPAAGVHPRIPLAWPSHAYADVELREDDVVVVNYGYAEQTSFRLPESILPKVKPPLCANDIAGHYVWVTLPGSNIVLYYAIPPSDADLKAALAQLPAPGEEISSQVLESFPPGIVQRLLQAGVLLTKRRLDEQVDEYREAITRGQESIRNIGFCVLRDLLPPPVLAALQIHAGRALERYRMQSRNDGHLMLWAEPFCAYLNKQLTGVVQDLSGVSRLHPERPLLLLYPEGSMLDLHIDKPNYPWSMSTTVDYTHPDRDPETGIGGEPTTMTVLHNSFSRGPWTHLAIDVGDFAVFPGTALPHYRHRQPPGCSLISISFAWDAIPDEDATSNES